MKKIAILGFGKEGSAVFHYLNRTGQLKDNSITILTKERNDGVLGIARANKNVTATSGKDYLSNLDKFDIIYRSPGFHYNSPEIQTAKKAKVKISSCTKTFFAEIENRSTSGLKTPTIIGITGTKGKGTVATILFEILKSAGKKVLLAGNIGNPALDILDEAKNSDFVILELSSFQLQDLNTSPQIAVILEISPDHLDVHKNLKEYRSAKANITLHQKENDAVFFFASSSATRAIAKKSKAQAIDIHPESFTQFKEEDIQLSGQHNFNNAIMATAVAMRLGISQLTIKTAIMGFGGLEHRIERVQNPRVQNIKFYNDSTSTIPESTIAAILSFKEPLVLIAGGKSKGTKYKSLIKALKKSTTEKIILFGENKKEILNAIKRKWKGEIELAKDLPHAVNLAHQYARQALKSGMDEEIIILFSPASASLDMFKNIYDRGEKFKALVKNLDS